MNAVALQQSLEATVLPVTPHTVVEDIAVAGTGGQHWREGDVDRYVRHPTANLDQVIMIAVLILVHGHDPGVFQQGIQASQFDLAHIQRQRLLAGSELQPLLVSLMTANVLCLLYTLTLPTKRIV